MQKIYKGNTGNYKWWNKFINLSEEQLAILKPIVEKNDFSCLDSLNIVDDEILDVLHYYTIGRCDVDLG